MYRYSILALITICLIFVGLGFAEADSSKEQEMELKPYTGSAELEKMKSLSGTWTGMGMIHGQEMPVSVEYRTTSNGTAVLETTFPGTPHEMVSVYYEEDGKLVMRHYCSLNNQPLMGIKSSDDDTLELDLIGGANMDVSSDRHMHSLVIKFVDSNSVTQTWTAYTEGKAMEETTTLTLSREK